MLIDVFSRVVEDLPTAVVFDAFAIMSELSLELIEVTYLPTSELPKYPRAANISFQAVDWAIQSLADRTRSQKRKGRPGIPALPNTKRYEQSQEVSKCLRYCASHP